jgi:Fe-S-cluster containining protein
MRNDGKRVVPVYIELISRVDAVLREVDEKTRRFRKACAIECPRGCGACCENPLVEATSLEFMPLAWKLWEEGRAEKVLRDLSRNKSGRCIFYLPEGDAKGRGSCRVYGDRGFICRIFGLFALRDKNSKTLLSACRVIKELYPQKLMQARRLLSEGFDGPYAGHFSYRLISIKPDSGSKLMPINLAVKAAIENAGMYYQWHCISDGERPAR